MGSSFSIINDTDQDIWIQNNTCWNAVIWPIAGVATVATAGAAGVGMAAAAGGSTAMVATMSGGAATIALGGTALGMSATTAGVAGTITGLSSSAVSIALHITKSEAEKLIKSIRDFKDGADAHLKPGERYTFDGTLSLVKTVHCMGGNLSRDKRDCWTGPTANSNHEYYVSEEFPNCALSVSSNGDGKETTIYCNRNKVFDVEGGKIRNGGNIILYRKHGGKNQRFSLTDRGNGYYSIDLIGTNYVLDIEEGSTKAGTNVFLYKYHGGGNQLWSLEAKDYYSTSDQDAFVFRSKKDSKMVLDVDRGASPNNLIIWHFHGGENQVFKINKRKTSSDYIEENPKLVRVGKHLISANVGPIWSHNDFLDRKDDEFANFDGLRDDGWEMTGEWWSKNGTSYVEYQKKWDKKSVEVEPIKSHADFLARKDEEFANFEGLGDKGWEMTGHWWSKDGTSFVQYQRLAKIHVGVGTIKSHADFLSRKDEEFTNLQGLGDKGWEMTGHWWSKDGTSFVQYQRLA